MSVRDQRSLLVLVLAACGATPSPAPSAPGPGAPPPLVTAALVPPDAAAAPAAAPVPVARPSGPLSYRIKVTETPWSDRQTAMRRNEARMVDKAGMLEDFAAYFAMVDEFYATRTREQADYLSTARDRVA